MHCHGASTAELENRRCRSPRDPPKRKKAKEGAGKNEHARDDSGKSGKNMGDAGKKKGGKGEEKDEGGADDEKRRPTPPATPAPRLPLPLRLRPQGRRMGHPRRWRDLLCRQRRR